MCKKIVENKHKVCSPILTFFRKFIKGSSWIRKVLDIGEIEPALGSGILKSKAISQGFPRND